MSAKLDQLSAQLKLALNDNLEEISVALNEITIQCRAENLVEACLKLRDHAE